MRILATALAIGGFAALPLAAQAADIEMAAPPHDWTGLYFGVHAGYGEADVNGLFDNNDGLGDFVLNNSGYFNLDTNGMLGGVQAGYNWQNGNLVLGLEGDASLVDWKKSLTNGDNETVSTDTDFLATLRLRAGFAMDTLLIYGTAGGAITDTSFSAVDINEGGSGSVDLGDIGLAVGGGAEWAFAPDWSFKVEGLYLYFNDKANTSALTNDSDTGDFAKLDDGWLVRAGLNWHF